MNSIYHKYLKSVAKISASMGLALSLSGCIVALPPAVQMASFALDGVSYITTGKSVSDHAISTITAQDCAMTRALKGDDICTAQHVEVAMRPDGTPVQMAADASRDITTGDQDKAFQAFSATHGVVSAEDTDEILDLSTARPSTR